MPAARSDLARARLCQRYQSHARRKAARLRGHFLRLDPVAEPGPGYAAGVRKIDCAATDTGLSGRVWPGGVATAMPVARSDRPLMGPGLDPLEGEIVGIGDLPLLRILGFDYLVRNALALAIGHRIFPGVEMQGELLLHVARRGPAHQGLDRPGLLRLIIQRPGPGSAARPFRKPHYETAPMKINAILPEKGRDLRLDLFRGVANWAIYLDHIPDNVVNWITTRNYGFSDAADLFVFISGYTASFV